MIADIVMTIFVISLLGLSAGLTGYVLVKYGDTKEKIALCAGVLLFAVMIIEGIILK